MSTDFSSENELSYPFKSGAFTNSCENSDSAKSDVSLAIPDEVVPMLVLKKKGAES